MESAHSVPTNLDGTVMELPVPVTVNASLILVYLVSAALVTTINRVLTVMALLVELTQTVNQHHVLTWYVPSVTMTQAHSVMDKLAQLTQTVPHQLATMASVCHVMPTVALYVMETPALKIQTVSQAPV